jgi:hypothetical protein
MKQFLIDLRTSAWRTAGARYNAARRLKQREWFSTFSLAALSALTIAVAFAQKVYSPKAGTPLDNYLSAIAVALGVFLLVISLMEWGAGYGGKADGLHRNAELLTAFQRKLAQALAQIDAGWNPTFKDVDDFRLEYDSIKDTCQHNHIPVDDALFRASHRLAPEFTRANGEPMMGGLKALLTRVHWRASELWFFAIVWVLVAASLAYSFWLPAP